MTYKLLGKDFNGKDSDYIIRKSDGAFIPKDEANADYQDYLEWAKTNTPEAAD